MKYNKICYNLGLINSMSCCIVSIKFYIRAKRTGEQYNGY